MNFIYTNHAKENLIERKINKFDVEDAISHPEEVIEGKKGRKIAHKVFRK